MSEQLFNLSDEYDAMLQKGISLSGEDRDFFVHGRLRHLKKRMQGRSIKRILDFGCGTGQTSRALSAFFPGARVDGVDTAVNAVTYAREHNQNPDVSFFEMAQLPTDSVYDLCYVNGVFHHIDVGKRASACETIVTALKAGGTFAFFENNPWNPGTRMVMRRIPFDRDAVTLSYLEAKRMLKAATLHIMRSDFLFYFPRSLRWFRVFEPLLKPIPLGAQYVILTEKRQPD